MRPADPWSSPEVVRVEFPEKIDLESLANYNEMKKIYNSSMEKMEEVMRKSLEQIDKTYKDHMKQMKEAFQDKEKQFVKVHEQLETNNRFICQHGNDVQNILEEHRDAIIDEKNVEYQKLRDA